MMVSVRYALKDAPYIGQGRWTLPLSLLNNERMLEKLAEKGIELQSNITKDRIKCTDRHTINIQMHWEAYKTVIKKVAKETAKECYHKITSCIKALEKDIKETNNNPKMNTNNNLQAHEAYLAN